jgi:hypothetical protein
MFMHGADWKLMSSWQAWEGVNDGPAASTDTTRAVPEILPDIQGN